MANTFSNTDIFAKSAPLTPYTGTIVTLETFGSGWSYIGDRESTTDVASIIFIDQQIAGANLRIHQPTDLSITKIFTIVNTGSEAFLFKGHGPLSDMGGTMIAAGTGIVMVWNGNTQGFYLVGQGTAVLPE